MYIHLRTSNEFIVQAVYTRIKEEFPDDTVLTSVEEIFEHNYRPRAGFHILSHGALPVFDEASLERWYHLHLASLGARFWAEEGNTSGAPTHAGSIKQTEAGINKIVVDAIYSERRAALFQSYGINYVGRTYSDPRTAILVDYKGDKTHNPTNDLIMQALFTALPEDEWASEEPHDWGTFAIISTANVARLVDFMDMLSETNILAYSAGSMAKLNFIGRDYGRIGVPRSEKKYGLDIRETASRMKVTSY